jgi:hypothetical protein
VIGSAFPRLLALGVLVCAAACTPQLRADTRQPPGPDGGVAPPGKTPPDRDHDGLCDATEQDLGSDPDALDSDHDGYPDAVELLNGFDPVSPDSPGLDQVAFLASKMGAGLDFGVRATVDGDGESYTGILAPYPSNDSDQRTILDFYQGGVAVSAEPPENVHAVDAQAERFDTVLGHTRLSFALRFEYSSADDFPCAEGFSFAYATKTDQGHHPSSRDYMLVVVPKDSTGRKPEDYCLPETCL